MRPSKLASLLATTIDAKLPILIKGAPGVGKSDIVAQAAEAAGANMVLMHPVVSDPTDFKGLPAIVNDQAEFLPFGDLKALVNAKVLTVAFLDDLGQAPAVVQAAAMQLILARRVNGHKVSDHVVFIAATNRREDRAGVTGILEPVKSRFVSIIELEANVEDWTTWAIGHEVPAEVIAFVRFRPDLLTTPGAPTNDIVNRPSPRTFAHLSKLVKHNCIEPEMLAGAVGEGCAVEFLSFLRICQTIPTIESILTSPKTAIVPTEPAALYAVTCGVASATTKKNIADVMQYLNRLPDDFSVLGVRDIVKRCPNVVDTPTYINWAVEHQDVLV